MNNVKITKINLDFANPRCTSTQQALFTFRRQGCHPSPQGGILSPLVWNLAFDDLLDRSDSGPAHIKVFADDAAIILRGPDIYTPLNGGKRPFPRPWTLGVRTP